MNIPNILLIETYQSIINYLSLISSSVYLNSGRFSENDLLEIKKKGFKVTSHSYCDGKILSVKDKNIFATSEKCNCEHSISFYGHYKNQFSIHFYEVGENNKFSNDPVCNLIKRDDLDDEKWFISNVIDETSIGLITDNGFIPLPIKFLFDALQEYIKENNKDLRIRLIIDHVSFFKNL